MKAFAIFGLLFIGTIACTAKQMESKEKKTLAAAAVNVPDWINITDENNETVTAINRKTKAVKFYVDSKEHIVMTMYDAYANLQGQCNQAIQQRAQEIQQLQKTVQDLQKVKK